MIRSARVVPHHYIVACRTTAGTVEFTDHFLCVVNRDSVAHTVSVSVDPVETGSGIGLTVEVPPDSTDLHEGLVTEPGPYTVTIRTDGSQMTFDWEVDAEEITGVRVVFDEGSVRSAAGVTGDCSLDAWPTVN